MDNTEIIESTEINNNSESQDESKTQTNEKLDVVFSTFDKNTSSKEILEAITSGLNDSNTKNSRILLINFTPENSTFSFIDCSLLGKVAIFMCTMSLCSKAIRYLTQYLN